VKKFFLIISLVVASITTATAANNIGVVDVQYVLSKAPQRVAISEKLNAEFKERTEELKALVDKGRSIQENAEKNSATMSQQERIETNRQLQELQSQITFKEKTLKEDSARRGQEEQRALYGVISQQIDAVAKEGNFDMIVNREALLWVGESVNISDLVLAKLNAIGN